MPARLPLTEPAPATAPDAPPLPAASGEACFTDGVQPAGGALRPKVTPSRTRGVAPLAVFFDTRGTSADSAGQPFRDLAYCWQFGDAQAGVFAATGRARSGAMGPVAAHVFETPGSYRVTLTVRDRQGRTASTGVTVHVDDPSRVFAGEATVCLSDNRDFAGCPAGARHVTGNDIAESLGREVQPGQRLLLRRGGSFTGALRLDVPGPGVIGAFGPASAARPRISNHKGETFAISGEEGKFSDWRLMDLELAGTEATRGVGVGGRAKDLAILRVRATGLGGSVIASESIINYLNDHGSPGHDVIDGLFLQDSELRQAAGGLGHGLMGIAGRRVLVAGNVLRDSTGGEHVLRAFFLERAVISNNDFGEAPKGRHLLKLHAPKFDRPGVGRGKHSQEIVISENLFRGTGGHEWSVAVGPQNGTSDERVRDLVVERNLFTPGPDAQVALMLQASGVTVRDNVFDRGAGSQCIAGGRRGVEPAPSDVLIVHNTCYSTAESPFLAKFDGTVQGLRVFNNLLVGPHVSAVVVRPDGAETGGNVALPTPEPRASAWNRALDFMPEPSSPALDAALPLHQTPWDFLGRKRPQDGNADGSAVPDVGALERAP